MNGTQFPPDENTKTVPQMTFLFFLDLTFWTPQLVQDQRKATYSKHIYGLDF